MSLDELLDVDVSVASKVESNVADAPSSVTVFTQAEIRRMGVLSLQELMNYVPGFQSMRDVEQGLAAPFAARGRNTAISESVLVLVDGQRVNDLYTGGATLLNREMVVENIRQVEIIRGPGSALYGANAFLGVIDVKTLRGVNALWLSAGTYGSRSAAAAATQKVGDVTVDAFVKVSEFDGFNFPNLVDDKGLVGSQKDPMRTLDANAGIEYKGARLQLRHMARELHGFLTFASLQDADGNHEDEQQTSATLSYTRKIGKKGEITGIAGYSEDEWRALSLVAPAGFELAPGFVLPASFYGGPLLRTRVFSAGVDGKWDVCRCVTLAGGLAAETSKYSDIVQLSTFDPVTFDYLGGIVAIRGDNVFNKLIRRNTFGAYAQGTYKYKDMLTATVGVRFDDYNDFGSSLNPRAAVVYRTPAQSRVKLMYGRAFRAPNFLELHDQVNPVDFGNENLKAETVDTVELAYVQDIGKRFRGTLTFYNNTLKDLVVFGRPTDTLPPDPANPFTAPTYDNSGSLTVQGAELELRAQVVAGLEVYGTYSHLEGDDTPRFPRNFGALALNYGWKKLNVNVSGIGRGRVASLVDETGLHRDPYIVANARVEYGIGPHASVFVNARNLTDNRYLTPASLIPTGVPNDGRLVLVGLVATP